MVKIDFDNVLIKFGELSGCDVEQINENSALITNAVFQVEAVLDEEKCTDSDTIRAEFAAAAFALYDYVCKENARERIICTMTGKAAAKEDFGNKLLAAKKLKYSALETLRGVVIDNDFLFMTMEG